MTTDTSRVMRATHQDLRSGSARPRHVLLRFLELQVPMALGAFICLLVIRQIPPSSSLAAVYHPDTYLFAIGDTLFLTLPVVTWMIIRGYGRRQSAETALAMLVPLLAIVAFGELAGYAYLPWLTVVGYPALSLGMLGYLLTTEGRFAMIETAIQPHARSTRNRPLLVVINKRALNRVVLKLAGRRWSPWAIVQHVGRQSGRRYATPVVATRTTKGLVIPLPFGADTDWCRNALAAGRFTLRWHRRDYALEQPKVLQAHALLRLLGLKHYLMASTVESHVHGPIEEAPGQVSSGGARVGRFVRHLVEMVLAMMLGMALFGGLRALANPTGFADVFRDHLDVRYLAMTAFMAVPMIALMRYRGHSWARTTEMMLAMVVPVAAACLLWRFGVGEVVPALSEKGLGTSSHVVMYVGMLLAMLYRYGDYAHAGSHARSSPVPRGEMRARA